MSLDQEARYERLIAQAEEELVDREAELTDLKVELYAFRLEYDTRVGRQVEELERIEAEIRRCNQRIREYRQWGSAGPPRTRVGTEYVPVEEQYQRTWRQTEPLPAPAPESRAREPIGGELKQLYRHLCRQYHPDLTQDDGERAWRTGMMATINAAYAERDVEKLRSLGRAPSQFYHQVGVRPGPMSVDQRLDALRARLVKIRRRVQEVEAEIQELVSSPTMEMSLQVTLARRKGKDLLAKMAGDVEKDLERKRIELDFLIVQMDQLGIAHKRGE